MSNSLPTQAKPGWSQARPSYKLALGLAILVAALISPQPGMGVFLFLVTGSLLHHFLGIPWRRFLRCYLIPLVYILLSVLAVGIEFGPFPASRELLFHIGSERGMFMTFEGAHNTLVLTFRVLSSLAGLFFIRLSCSMVDFMQGLKGWHLPTGFLTLMELIYRMVFSLHTSMQNKIDAQNQRLGYVGLRRGVRSLGMALGSSFSAMLKKSDRMGRALDLRLYQGSLQTLPKLYPNAAPAEREMRLALVLIVLITGLVLAFHYGGHL